MRDKLFYYTMLTAVIAMPAVAGTVDCAHWPSNKPLPAECEAQANDGNSQVQSGAYGSSGAYHGNIVIESGGSDVQNSGGEETYGPAPSSYTFSCDTQPTCEQLGYWNPNDSSSVNYHGSCNGLDTLLCPFDTSKVFCTKSTATTCNVADYPYSCSTIDRASGVGDACEGKFVNCTCEDPYEWNPSTSSCDCNFENISESGRGYGRSCIKHVEGSGYNGGYGVGNFLYYEHICGGSYSRTECENKGGTFTATCTAASGAEYGSCTGMSSGSGSSSGGPYTVGLNGVLKNIHYPNGRCSPKSATVYLSISNGGYSLTKSCSAGNDTVGGCDSGTISVPAGTYNIEVWGSANGGCCAQKISFGSQSYAPSGCDEHAHFNNITIDSSTDAVVTMQCCPYGI